MKFKVGDKVKVNIVNPKHTWLLHLSGKQGIIERAFPCANPDKGCYQVSGMEYVMSEDDLELIKPIFNINDYPEGYDMLCKTEEEAKTFLSYLHGIGKKWLMGQSLLEVTYYEECPMCYTWKDDKVTWHHESFRYWCKNLNFEDFDWSDFKMKKKEFTKKDLKNGDVIKYRNGEVGIVCVETGTVILKDNEYMAVENINDDLTNSKNYIGSGADWDIMAVRRASKPYECRLLAFDKEYGILVYERKEVEEMTLEEVCKALGKEIKIVKK